MFLERFIIHRPTTERGITYIRKYKEHIPNSPKIVKLTSKSLIMNRIPRRTQIRNKETRNFVSLCILRKFNMIIIGLLELQ